MKQQVVDREKQRGVAVIMALLLTTLAITIVASLFWQQQVQVRLIENQRLQLQKQWILRGALDWAGLILREDAKYSSVDTLDEPWSVPLAETRLDQYVENGKADSDVADTTLSGGVSDAQARYNLNNLCHNGTIDPTEIGTYAKLLSLLNMATELAQSTAQAICQPIPDTKIAPDSTSKPLAYLGYSFVEDLLAVPGYTPALISKIKPYVVFLPGNTNVNINTASAEVISAEIPDLTLSDARTLLVSRKSAHFRDIADISNRLIAKHYNTGKFGVSSSYFLINGKVRMDKARMDMQALIIRNGLAIRILWIRES